MKITRIRFYQNPLSKTLFNQSAHIVTVETDAGVTGIGEGGSKDTVEQCAQMIIGEDGAWIISADHGNAEMMIDPVTKQPHTYHTTNPAPFILVNDQGWKLRPDGALQDIAPTLLGMLGEEQRASAFSCGILVWDLVTKRLYQGTLSLRE